MVEYAVDKVSRMNPDRPDAAARFAMPLRLSAATVALLGSAALADAAPTFTPPVGVSTYRLLFLTDHGIAGASTDIATYNGFATTEAGLNPSLPSTNWTAIVSTPTLDAGINVSCGLWCDANVPIYRLDGTLIASSTDAFFGGLIHAPTNLTQLGSTRDEYVWTGSQSDGQAFVGREMGGTQGTEQGYDNVSPSVIVDAGTYDSFNGVNSSPSDTYSLYALSAPIPEPVTGTAVLLGGLLVTGVFRRRRKQPGA